MNPFDSGQYAGQIPSQGQEQARRKSFPARNRRITWIAKQWYWIKVQHVGNHPVDGKQQNARSQQTSMDFGAGGNTMENIYQFNPSVNQGNDANILFTGNDPMSMQRYQQNQTLFHDPKTSTWTQPIIQHIRLPWTRWPRFSRATPVQAIFKETTWRSH